MRFFPLSKTKILLVAACAAGFAIPLIASALTFNPGNIISNSEFFNYNSLARKDISYFLKQKGSYLSGYVVNSKSAAQIIYDKAQEYHVNPKVILATLQKEQSLITDSTPSQTQLDCAMGYEYGNGCQWMFTNKPGLKGFANQVNAGTWQMRCYTDKKAFDADCSSAYAYSDGGTYSISGTTVKITNKATAALYNYTPYIAGNKSFWTIYNSWFTVIYPDGSLLNPEGEPGIWLIQDGKKYPFYSKAAFLSRYDLAKVITVPASVLDAYPLGAPIKYPDLSLLRAPTGGIYLILDGKRYAITSKQIFYDLGFNDEEIQDVSWDELNVYADGPKITTVQSTPSGRLLQSRQTGAIYFVEGTIRHAIHSKEILRSRYPYLKWITVEQTFLDSLTKGADIKFNDGELVASPNSNGVYLISDGKKRPIPSMEVFNGMGYKWSNIIWTTDRALAAHPLGDKITLFSL